MGVFRLSLEAVFCIDQFDRTNFCILLFWWIKAKGQSYDFFLAFPRAVEVPVRRTNNKYLSRM